MLYLIKFIINTLYKLISKSVYYVRFILTHIIFKKKFQEFGYPKINSWQIYLVVEFLRMDTLGKKVYLWLYKSYFNHAFRYYKTTIIIVFFWKLCYF